MDSVQTSSSPFLSMHKLFRSARGRSVLRQLLVVVFHAGSFFWDCTVHHHQSYADLLISCKESRNIKEQTNNTTLSALNLHQFVAEVDPYP